ncbi:hypothetical protein, partial [Pseudomonas aeruginosa]|uniref:hypothetical protein n=1 Tax=Pseudomonas aeruginosa TaxID=287 RepID=UPI001C3148C4
FLLYIFGILSTRNSGYPEFLHETLLARLERALYARKKARAAAKEAGRPAMLRADVPRGTSERIRQGAPG